MRSTQGLDIFVKATVEESDANGFGDQNRNLKSVTVTTSEFGAFRVVFIFICSANHYPNSWSYQSESVVDAFQSSGGADFEARDYSSHQLEYAAGSGGDSDKCRTEMALVKDGRWQTDPVNGSNNFVLGL